MAVSNLPNSVYIWKSVIDELAAVSKATGYYSDIAEVRQPPYFPDDGKSLAADAPEGASIYGWALSDRPSDSQLGANAGADIWALDAAFIGIVKRRDNPQQLVRLLAADLIRVMRQNNKRTYPGADASLNTYGRDTQAIAAIDYDYFKTDENVGVAGFYSLWRFFYKFPLATG